MVKAKIYYSFEDIISNHNNVRGCFNILIFSLKTNSTIVWYPFWHRTSSNPGFQRGKPIKRWQHLHLTILKLCLIIIVIIYLEIMIYTAGIGIKISSNDSLWRAKHNLQHRSWEVRVNLPFISLLLFYNPFSHAAYLYKIVLLQARIGQTFYCLVKGKTPTLTITLWNITPILWAYHHQPKPTRG